MEIFKIKQIMKDKKITQDMLAEKSGISISTIKDIMREKTKNPGIKTMNAIYEALGIEENQVIFDGITELKSNANKTYMAHSFGGHGREEVETWSEEEYQHAKNVVESFRKIKEMEEAKKAEETEK